MPHPPVERHGWTKDSGALDIEWVDGDVLPLRVD